MRKSTRVWLGILMLSLGFATFVYAKSTRSYVTTIDHPIPGENLYEVSIDRIDGRTPPSDVNIPIEPGQHTIGLVLQLDMEWTSKLNLAVEVMHNLTVDVEEGTTYVLAGKVNPNATPDEQKAGTYWHPVIYETRTRHH